MQEEGHKFCPTVPVSNKVILFSYTTEVTEEALIVVFSKLDAE